MQRYNFTNPLFLLKIESMIRRFFIIICLLFLTACDDGDIITVDLEFDQELERCDNFEDVYLLYDTREDPNESLTLILPKPAYNYLFTTATPEGIPEVITIANDIRFNYRIYNKPLSNDVLCNPLSDPDLVVQEDYEATSGNIKVTVTVVDDDDDGIPSADEGQDPNGDGDFSDAQDSDGDGIPDYLDEDDDNDNVKTEDEDDNNDNDDNPFTDFRDTDGDTIPDYLDTDDDGDGIDTNLEDENGDILGIPNPLDDFQESNDGTPVPPRFLDNNAVESFAFPGLIENSYIRTIRSRFSIENAGLTIINSDIIEFGTFETTETIED